MEETEYHKEFKLQRIKNTRKHFKLTTQDI